MSKSDTIAQKSKKTETVVTTMEKRNERQLRNALRQHDIDQDWDDLDIDTKEGRRHKQQLR